MNFKHPGCSSIVEQIVKMWYISTIKYHSISKANMTIMPDKTIMIFIG